LFLEESVLDPEAEAAGVGDGDILGIGAARHEPDAELALSLFRPVFSREKGVGLPGYIIIGVFEPGVQVLLAFVVPGRLQPFGFGGPPKTILPYLIYMIKPAFPLLNRASIPIPTRLVDGTFRPLRSICFRGRPAGDSSARRGFGFNLLAAALLSTARLEAS
jgi:hypothetical protein